MALQIGRIGVISGHADVEHMDKIGGPDGKDCKRAVGCGISLDGKMKS